MLKEDSDPCALEEQWDGHDDRTCTSAAISPRVHDLTLQSRDDTSRDPHVSAPGDDELPRMTMTHLSSFQAPMIAMTHEDRSGMLDMMEELYVRDTNQRHMDPQIQDNIYDVQIVDPTLTYQHEEIESPLLGTPLVE
jgi:hypothetical protein